MRVHLSIAILAFAQVIVKAATPPACLISAIGAQSNPADIKVICGKLQQQVISNITEKCTGAVTPSAAMSAYAATCLSEASIEVVMNNDTNSKPIPNAVPGPKPIPASTDPNSGPTKSTNTAAGLTSTSPASAASCSHSSTALKYFLYGISASILLQFLRLN